MLIISEEVPSSFGLIPNQSLREQNIIRDWIQGESVFPPHDTQILDSVAVVALTPPHFPISSPLCELQ